MNENSLTFHSLIRNSLIHSLIAWLGLSASKRALSRPPKRKRRPPTASGTSAPSAKPNVAGGRFIFEGGENIVCRVKDLHNVFTMAYMIAHAHVADLD